jgi:NADH-quinone oxidoreductase subunit L
VIDGILHGIARLAMRIGSFLRNYIDIPVINRSADRLSDGVKRSGLILRVVQSGRVQQYLIIGLLFTGAVLTYLLLVRP